MESTVEKALQRAVAAHSQGNLQEAELCYQAILQIQPEHPEANHNLGLIAIVGNQSAEALPLFKMALKGNPNIEQFWLSYIDALTKENQIAHADRALKEVRKRGFHGENLEALQAKLLALAEGEVPYQNEQDKLLACYQVGKYDDAEKLAALMIQQFPKYHLGWQAMGALLSQKGMNIEALYAFQKLTELVPQDAEAHRNLGVVLRELARTHEAKESFRQAIALKSDYPDAHNDLGITLQELGRLDEAEVSYRQATALNPDHIKSHNNLGGTLHELGRWDEAEASLTRAIALKPDYADAHYNLGHTLYELGRLDEAEVSYRQASALEPDFAEAYWSLGNVHRELGRFDEAEVTFRQAITLKPDFVAGYHSLGTMLRDEGRLEESEAILSQAIGLEPDFAEAHTSLGNTLQNMGRLDESVRSFQQAFAIRTGIRPVGDDFLAPATTSLYFELTNKCNFHCTFCPSDSQKRNLGFMDIELVKQLYEENADKEIAYEVNLHLMGEPTLHPELIEILSFGALKKIKTSLVTNISTLVAKNVPQILDALYGHLTASHMTPTAETYHFRGKVGLSWDRYISNLRLLVREYMKRLVKGGAIKNEITIRVMATENTASNVNIIENVHEARAVLKEWNDFVAEVEQELGMTPFKRKDHNADDLVRGNNHSSTSYPLQQGIKLTFWRAFTFANTRVSDDFDLKTITETAYCPHPFIDVGVLWNGDVTLCCLDHDGQLKVGNVRDSSIETVIQSESAQKLRASMLGNYPLPPVCRTCQAKPFKQGKADIIIQSNT